MSLLVPVAVAFTVFTLALVRVAYVAGRPAAPQPEREDPALIAAYERALGMPANPAEPWPLWKPEDGVRELAPLYPPSADPTIPDHIKAQFGI